MQKKYKLKCTITKKSIYSKHEGRKDQKNIHAKGISINNHINKQISSTHSNFSWNPFFKRLKNQFFEVFYKCIGRYQVFEYMIHFTSL